MACPTSSTIVVALLALLSSADIYLHSPAGSNNRNRERKDNRNNANRMFDSQNNGKGGYPWNGDPRLRASPDPLTYYVGSKLRIEWTNQHACGGNPDIHCELVIQYACEDTMPGLRDGYPNGEGCWDSTNDQQGNQADVPCDRADFTARKWIVQNTGQNDEGTNAIPNPRDQSQRALTAEERYSRYVNGTNNYIQFGLHENHLHYESCFYTERNKGLYNSDQKLAGNNARFTRQNPNGGRRGLECPEERDYYPYWRLSPWKDAAVLVSNISFCPMIQTQSQNVRGYGKCECPTDSQNNPCPITEASCTSRGHTWSFEESHGLPPPACLYHPFNRDNHLGNSYEVDPQTGKFLTPREGDQPESPHYEWTIPPDMADKKCIVRLRYNMSTEDYDSHAFYDPSNAKCNYQGDGAEKNDFQDCGQGVGYDAAKNCPYITSESNCGDGNPDCNSQTVAPNVAKPTQCYFDMTENSLPIYNRPYINLFNENTTANEGFRLGLAINTHQTGRTFQDRSYVFQVRQPPVGGTIKNLGLRGRRGNIVQTYPAVEYDFTPSIMRCGPDDYIHIQFHGTDFNDDKNANNGEGFEYSSRTNMIEIPRREMNYPLYHTKMQFFSAQNARKFAWVGQDPAQCDTQITDDDNTQNQYTNCGKLNMMKNRFPQNPDDGLVKCDKPAGSYYFMSSRNNNFSNRAQKSEVRVSGGDEEDKLSTGAIIAISFAVVFFVGAVAAGVALYMKKKEVGCFKAKTEGGYATAL